MELEKYSSVGDCRPDIGGAGDTLGLFLPALACPKSEEGRTGEDAQTDANTTDRRTQNRQTQTEVRQDDNVRSRRTSEDTDEMTTERQRSQFAVVKDEATKHLIVDNPTHPHSSLPAQCLGSSAPPRRRLPPGHAQHGAETKSTPNGVANQDPMLTKMSSETLGGEGERIARTRFQGQVNALLRTATDW